MADQNQALSDSERAELEALRAEKAAREQEARAAAERAELEALRAEKAAHDQEARAAAQRAAAQQAAARQELEEDARIAEVRERNRQLMEPDEDLNMPVAQKIVLAVLALVVIAAIVYFTLGG